LIVTSAVPAHHHPVFGAMAMLLQRQHAAGDDDDALHLEALAHVDRLVIAPWPMHATVVDGLAALLLLELGDEVFHLLREVLAWLDASGGEHRFEKVMRNGKKPLICNGLQRR